MAVMLPMAIANRESMQTILPKAGSKTATVTYQVDGLGGTDPAMCALFIYLVHWAEIGILVRNVEIASRVGSGNKENYLVECPEGLLSCKNLLTKGLLTSGPSSFKIGLDMLEAHQP